ncbi:hypothetical protein KSS87_007643 [Heliosperma pusillum]|nr:hypothetical protein KSS87_007643 [Heliosperma pusillum]
MKRSTPASSTSEVCEPTKKKRNYKERLPVLRTRMSPAGLYHFLHNEDSPLSEKQIQAIQEMGFGSLLLLQIKKVPGSLAYWLVSNYDPIKGCLLDGKLPILEEVIYLSLGLPMGPNVVIEASNGDKCPVYLSVLEKFKSQFGNDSIDVKDILAKLPTQKRRRR